MGWTTWLCRLGSVAVGLLGVAIAALYVFQEKILYVPVVPGMDLWVDASKYGLEAKDVDIMAADGISIHGWLLSLKHWTPEFMKSRPVVLFFQENAGNMSYRLHFLRAMIRALNCPVFAVSYRGYGKSKGTPGERGLKLDAEAGLRHLMAREDVDGSRVVLFGKSLGGAVAIYLTSAYQSKIKALIIENTFTSVEDMVPNMLPFLSPFIGTNKPLNFLVTNKWSNLKTLPKITDVPILMLVSGKDEMVPCSQMYRLHKVQQTRACKLVKFPEAHHMDAYDVDPDNYWGAMAEFVESYAK